MRILMWHCDRFRSELTEKGRSPVREDAVEKVVDVGECIVVYAACEKGDEQNPSLVVDRVCDEIVKHAKQLGASTVVLHSFAHLFVELSAPHVALDILKQSQARLQSQGLTTLRSPFGWFNTLDLKAKGHPLSRVARQIDAT